MIQPILRISRTARTLHVRRFTLKLRACVLLLLMLYAGCSFQSPTTLTGEVRVIFFPPDAGAADRQLQLTAAAYPVSKAASPQEMTDQWIISFETWAAEEKRLSVLNALSSTVIRELPFINGFVVSSSEDLASMAHAYDAVRYAEPNTPVYSLFPTWEPDDPLYAEYQWNLQLVRMPQAWTIGTGERNIRVAVLDSGINASHPDLAGVIDETYARSFIDNDSPLTDSFGHGTYVAGIIGAVWNNSIGITGVMGEHITLLPVKVLSNDGTGTSDALAKGILYAAGLLQNPHNPYPAEVINLSLAYEAGVSNTTVKEALDAALNAGVVITAASGNYDNNDKDGSQAVRFPANHPGVIAVGASDEVPQPAVYSCYGTALDILAPVGGGVISTSHEGNSYDWRVGTSMAAPQAAGVIALMLASGIDAAAIPALLNNTSMPLESSLTDPIYGHGLINAYLAVYQADTIRILVGRKEGDTIAAVAETSIGIRDQTFTLTRIPSGKYQVFAWIDVRKNDIIEEGDYLAETSLIIISGNIDDIALELVEILQ